ncbi:AraC family transcriptional regulator [Parafrankia sp. FMc2]|uniref:AraC family transcriptional regulator n=1 Tax=Parafrankia sp. FMc2 TaxID=3233196 RepID=UPI0034D65F66
MTSPAHLSGGPGESSTLVDLRRGGGAIGGSHPYEGERLVTGWHAHDLHQIEYAIAGVVEVETSVAHYLLPPQQAAWIPAGLAHQATMNAVTRTVAVMFDPAVVPSPGDRARILAVSPLIREMIIYSLRWPITRTAADSVADEFFRALGHLVAEALDHEAPLCLPTSTDPVLSRAMAYTRAHLGAVTVGEVSGAVGVSERSLRRQFRATLGLSWRSYLLQARILRAMELFSVPGRSVLEVATAVGFDNGSAFARAFTQYCGETPSAYQRRVGTTRATRATRAARPARPARPGVRPYTASGQRPAAVTRPPAPAG